MTFYLSGAISKATGGLNVADERFANAFCRIAEAFKLANPETEIFNPALAFKQYRGIWSEPQFLEACFEVLPHCPVLILIKDKDNDYSRSVGVKAELDYHTKNGGVVLELSI